MAPSYTGFAGHPSPCPTSCTPSQQVCLIPFPSPFILNEQHRLRLIYLHLRLDSRSACPTTTRLFKRSACSLWFTYMLLPPLSQPIDHLSSASPCSALLYLVPFVTIVLSIDTVMVQSFPASLHSHLARPVHSHLLPAPLPPLRLPTTMITSYPNPCLSPLSPARSSPPLPVLVLQIVRPPARTLSAVLQWLATPEPRFHNSGKHSVYWTPRWLPC